MIRSPSTSAYIFKLVLFVLTAFALNACSDSDKPEKASTSAQANLATSERYIKQGQYRAAIIEVRNAIQKQPSAKTLGALAQIYTDLGQDKSAQRLLEEHVEQFPALYNPLTRTYISRGKYISAEASLKKIDPSSIPESEYKLLEANILIGKGDSEAGYKSLKQLKDKFPKNREVLRANLISAFYFGTPDESEAVVSKALETFPKDPDILSITASIRFRQKNFTGAEELLMQALNQTPQADILTPQRANILNLLSKTLTQQGRYADALPFEKLLKEANPDAGNIQAQLSEAIAALQSGNTEEGEKLLKKLNEDFPGMDQTEALLGVVSLEHGEADKASELFSKSVDPETAAPKLSAAAAIAELRLDRRQNALDILAKATQTNPDSLQLQTLFGLAASNVPAQRKQSIKALEKAIELGSSDLRVYNILARLYSLNNQIEESAKILGKAAATFSTTPEQLSIFSSYQRLGFTKEAIAFTKDTKKKQPKSEAGWLMSAANRINSGDHAGAQKELDIALKLNADNEYGWLLSGANAAGNQDWNKASKYFQHAVKLNPDSQHGWQGLLRSEINKNSSWKDIVALFDSLATDSAHRNQLSTLLASQAISESRFSDADALIQKIKASESASPKLVEGLTIRKVQAQVASLVTAEKTKDALALLADTSDTYPDRPEPIVMMGNLYLHQKDYTEAEKILNRLNSLNQPTTAALFETDLLMAQGQTELASNKLNQYWAASNEPRIASAIYKLSVRQQKQLPQTFLDEWRAAAPSNPQPVLLQAINAQQKGSPDTQRLYEKVLELDPRNIAALNNLAWMYQQQGDLKKANKLASTAIQIAPTNAAILDTAGYIKLKLGNKESLDILKKAYELAPDQKEIEEHYKQAKQQF